MAKKHLSNKTKDIIMKTLLVIAGICELSGFIGAWVSINNGPIGMVVSLILMVPIPAIILGVFLAISFTLKSEGDNAGKLKEYKIKYYNCTLKEELADRMNFLYDGVKHIPTFSQNFYASYHKENQVIIVAVMYVDSMFNEDEYIAFISEIPEVDENVFSHMLIVIFVEREHSSYLKEIMYSPEYYTPLETKVFCVYDMANNRLKVNKTTNEWSGNKGYNNARNVLDKIFIFEKEKQE